MLMPLLLASALAAPGDECDDPIPLTPDTSVAGTTVGQAFENAGTCVTSQTTGGQWYAFTAPSDGTLELDTCAGASYDTKISVYTDLGPSQTSPPACDLGCVTGNDDFCGLRSFVSAPLSAGETVLVLVHGFGAATGTFTLTNGFTPSAPTEPPMDCTGRDPAVCAFVDRIVEAINGEAGSLVVTEGSPTPRFRPTNLYGKLERVRNQGATGPCGVTATSGGLYDLNAATWSGTDWNSFFGEVAAGGAVTRSPRSWSGSGLLGAYGDRFGVYNSSGQVAGSAGAGGALFAMGHWVRIAGPTGFYANLVGACSGVDYADVFDPWYAGPLP